jgi:parallel beta-helix repeat protein
MKKSAALAIFASLVAGIGAPAAQAVVSCGTTVTGKEVMTSDLACFDDPAFTIDGGEVDMNGHRVACLPGTDGVHLINSGGKLLNGFIEGCDVGVALVGSGGHTVSNVLVRDSGIRGFVILGAKNKLIRNTALDNAADGFMAASPAEEAAHAFVGNVAAGNGESGFEIHDNKNKLSQNVAYANGAEGFVLDGDGNKLSRNTAYDNGGIGISLDGAGNSLSSNTSIGNDSVGVAAYGEENKLKGNLALDNNGVGFSSVAPGNAYTANLSAFNANDGYLLFGAGVVLSRSAAIGNAGDGFQAALAYQGFVVKGNRLIANGALGINMQGNDSKISGNFAFDNTTDDADDNNVDCATNTWKKNVFHSTADACIE